MKITYKVCMLSPYPGKIYVFRDLSHIRAKYTAMTGNLYEFEDEVSGGRYIHII